MRTEATKMSGEAPFHMEALFMERPMSTGERSSWRAHPRLSEDLLSQWFSN